LARGNPDSISYDSVGGTLGIVDTFRKNPHYGALKNSHLSMGYVDLRYTLP